MSDSLKSYENGAAVSDFCVTVSNAAGSATPVPMTPAARYVFGADMFGTFTVTEATVLPLYVIGSALMFSVPPASEAHWKPAASTAFLIVVGSVMVPATLSALLKVSVEAKVAVAVFVAAAVPTLVQSSTATDLPAPLRKFGTPVVVL